MNFICKKCDYSTKNKYHYIKHLTTQKHLKKKVLTCSICEEVYQSKSAYYRHNKTCKTQLNKKISLLENRIKRCEGFIKFFNKKDVSCEDIKTYKK